VICHDIFGCERTLSPLSSHVIASAAKQSTSLFFRSQSSIASLRSQ
jgi:hypothetical protein